MYMEAFFYAATVFTAILLLYTFRAGLTDFLYLAVKKWHHTFFILACVAAGTAMGVYYTGQGHVSVGYVHILEPKGDAVQARIDSCKQFVTAKLEHIPGYREPEPPLTDTIRIGARSYWDSCAHTFGTNYWKHDITINGENGGQVLCRAYREDSYRSGNVENWCGTVFAEGRKI